MSRQTALQNRIRDQLCARLRQEFQSGDRINETELAEYFGVSRTPVRQVLLQLEAAQIVEYQAQRGFLLKALPDAAEEGEAEGAVHLDERIMRDMALGQLNGVFSERALVQRYDVAHGDLNATLRLLMRDRLVEPSPGRGWIFAPIDREALADGYKFRQLVEPAAILADNYVINHAVLAALDQEHREAMERIEECDRRHLFDLDAKFHKLVADGAGIASLNLAIDRQNNIRRVAEYLGYLRTERLHESMQEHRQILAALLDGERQLAAALMRVHLQVSMDQTFEHLEADLRRARLLKHRLT